MKTEASARGRGRVLGAWFAAIVVALALWASMSCGPQPPGPPPRVSAVLLAEKTINIGDHDSVTGGDVVIQQIEPWVTADGGISTALILDGGPPSASPQLVVGQGSHVGVAADCTTGVGTVSAASISLAKKGCIGNAQTNSLSTGGATAASQTTFPSKPLGPLPLAPLPPTSITNVTVPAHGSMSLPPGNYGAVTVGPNATLTLANGSYSLQSLVVNAAATVTTSAACGVAVLTSEFTAEHGSAVTPATGCTAKDLAITIAQTQLVNIAHNATIRALIAAPHADLHVGPNASVTGALAGFNITLADHVTVAFEDGFLADAAGTQQLSDYYVQRLNGANGAIAPVPREAVFELDIGLPVPNPAGLQATIRAVSDPKSPQFRQYLTPSAFAAQFGASLADYNALVRWAVVHGFTIQQKFDSRLLLSVTGSVAIIEAAFRVNLMYRTGGMHPQGFVAVDRQPSLDLGPTILWIDGFDDFGTVAPDSCVFSPDGVTSGAVGTLSAADIRQAYLESTNTSTNCLGLDGTGQTVAILTFEDWSTPALNGILTHDVNDFVSIQPKGTPFTFSGNLSFIAPFTPGANGLLPGSEETPLDIEGVMSMAPGANIKLFMTPFDLDGHATSALHNIAQDPTVNVVTSSWNWEQFGERIPGNGPDSPFTASEQNALFQMAVEGKSYFQSSGDRGNLTLPIGGIDFPFSGNKTMDGEVLVGGTSLRGTNVTKTISASGGPILVYANPYWGGEGTWNDQCTSGGGITGGGLITNFATPWWQQGVPMTPFTLVPTCAGCQPFAVATGGNGGQDAVTQGVRTYPDVAALAELSFRQVDHRVVCPGGGNPCFEQACDPSTCVPNSNGGTTCCTFAIGGTSLASPLWAGFTALVNQKAALDKGMPTNISTVGFANPTIYGIGLTKGLPSGDDVYSSSFHDVRDGVFNSVTGAPLGFPAVDGYDLATGWGSPSCSLLSLLANPVFPQNFSDVYVAIQSGNDGLEDRTVLQFSITDTVNGTTTFTLKNMGDTGWEQGQTHVFSESLGSALSLASPISPTAVTSVALTIVEEPCSGCTPDNFDVGGIQVRLVNPHQSPNSAMACVIDLSGEERCDPQQPSCNGPSSSIWTIGGTADTGVTRLSSTPDCQTNCGLLGGCLCKGGQSGQGTIATFNLVGLNMLGQSMLDVGTCTPWTGGATPQPFDSVELILDTYTDGVNDGGSTGSVVKVLVQDLINNDVNSPPMAFQIVSGTTTLTDFTEWKRTVPIQSETLAKLGQIIVQFTPTGSDEWHVNGVHAVGRRSGASGQDTCLYDWTGSSPTGTGPPASQEIVFNAKFPNGSQNGSSLSGFTIGHGCP